MTTLTTMLLDVVTDHSYIATTAAALAASIAVIGAAWGISVIGKAAVESISRQPEAAGDIRASMIVSAAFIEGVTFFAIVVCLLILFI